MINVNVKLVSSNLSILTIVQKFKSSSPIDIKDKDY